MNKVLLLLNEHGDLSFKPPQLNLSYKQSIGKVQCRFCLSGMTLIQA